MCGGRYDAAFAALAALQPALRRDLYASAVLTDLLAHIRRRALQAYVKPYAALRLSALAEAFGADEGAVEAEVAALVAGGTLPLRLDAHNKVRRLLQFSCRGSLFVCSGCVQPSSSCDCMSCLSHSLVAHSFSSSCAASPCARWSH